MDTHTLYDEMKIALRNYTNHLQFYYDYLKEDVDSGSSHAQKLMLEVETYRTRYFQLRMQFEAKHGDVVHYQTKLNQFFIWRKVVKLQCLVMTPHDRYTHKSALALVK